MVNFTPKLRRDNFSVNLVDTLEVLTAKDLMLARFPKFHPDMDMELAMQEIISCQVTGGPVMDHAGRLVGFLSERDCLRLSRESRYNNSESGMVRQYMKAHVYTVQAGTKLRDLAEIFSDNWYHTYPVVEKTKVIGLLTRHAVLKAFGSTKVTTW